MMKKPRWDYVIRNSATVNDTSNNYEQGRIDRLSSLPDALLHEILSHLPIKSAINTAVLSRRWPHLWTHITNFSLDLSHVSSLESTVDHILRQLTSPKLRTSFLRGSIARGDYGSANPFESWIPQICARRPDEFTVNCYSSPFRNPWLSIPSCVFVTQSLVDLQLCCQNINYNLPDDGIINLPNLKKLSFHLSDNHLDLMTTLFKSCPLLEFLDLGVYLKNKDDNGVVHILAPNLKSLALFNRSRISVKFVIDAPKLEYFRTAGDDTTVHHFAKIPTGLLVAELDLVPTAISFSDQEHVKSLFRGISCVQSLTMNKHALQVLPVSSCGDDDLFSLSFHRLTYLKLTGALPGCVMSMPALMLSKLKNVDLVDVRKDELILVQRLLSYTSVLEHLRVSFYDHEVLQNEQLVMEYEFCSQLFRFSRTSADCEVQFSGCCISASSTDYKNGVLAAAQIRF